MRYSKGIMWLDDCRIPFVDSDKDTINFDRPRIREKKDWVYELGTTWENPDVKEYNQQGRFTPNLLVCDDMLNDGNIGGNNTNKFYEPQYSDTSNIYGKYKQLQVSQYKDKGTNSRYYNLDLWFDKMVDKL